MKVLTVGGGYEVDLLEPYTAESTTALYMPTLGLNRPAETCGALDEIESGRPMALRLTGAGSGFSCSFWIAEMLEPAIALGARNPLLANNQSSNQITVSGRRDFGDGCEGGWEFSLHAPGDDPFRDQSPAATPVLLAYRVFGSTAETASACAARVGRVRTGEFFTCGDVFVAHMSRR